VGDVELEKPNAAGRQYDIPTADFDAQMAYLAQHGYTPVRIEQIAVALAGGPSSPAHPVAITFDDANQDNWDNAFPILRKYGLFATFFVVAGWVGTPGHLTWEEIAAMQQAGMRFGAHSLTHQWLTRLSADEARREIVASRSELEAHLGVPVTVFAYPYGGASPREMKMVQGAGFVAALGTSPPRLTHTPAQRFYLTRLGVYRGTTLQGFGARLNSLPASTPEPQRQERVRDDIGF
jgi:peptidoglycan/xylan/chitin deacetylase (PgdA/CDA1 family)